MAEDMYGDSSDYGDSESDSRPMPERKASDKATALLPKDFFPSDKPLEVGNVCKVKIARVLDDQVEVTYQHDRDLEDEAEVAEDDEVAAMME